MENQVNDGAERRQPFSFVLASAARRRQFFYWRATAEEMVGQPPSLSPLARGCALANITYSPRGSERAVLGGLVCSAHLAFKSPFVTVCLGHGRNAGQKPAIAAVV